jgi:hypothetical protein
MRAIAILLAGVLGAACAAGCASETDKKNINKDRDRPVPRPDQGKAPTPAGGQVADRERPRGL